MALLGFGSAVFFNGLQPFQSSPIQDSAIQPCLVRTRICVFPEGHCKIVGWIAANSLPSFSVLAPQSKEPSARETGLFRTGPTWSSGKRRSVDQVCPSSVEAISMPHQVSGLGPTL